MHGSASPTVAHSRQRRAGCLCLLEQPRRALRRVRSRDVRALPGVRAIEGEEGDESSQERPATAAACALRRIGLCRLRGPGRSPDPGSLGLRMSPSAMPDTVRDRSTPARQPHRIRSDPTRGGGRITPGLPKARHSVGSAQNAGPRSCSTTSQQLRWYLPALEAVSPTTLHQFWLNPGPTPGPEPPELVRGQRGGPR